MNKKTTEELNNILKSTHAENLGDYIQDNSESILSKDRPFAEYMRLLIKEKGLKQQDIFLDADIPERYGYKLISEEKRTKQRDIILRICYAAGFTLSETQRALKIYEMPQLYSKIPRDALLMIIFNERPGSILDVNALLKKYDMETLRSSGVQE
ncbi:MAG: hypothetical protein IJ608_03570 [Lachnospiraceae bacterium]|nr:hypothetical protein [Lachnospiraceae bacterium]